MHDLEFATLSEEKLNSRETDWAVFDVKDVALRIRIFRRNAALVRRSQFPLNEVKQIVRCFANVLDIFITLGGRTEKISRSDYGIDVPAQLLTYVGQRFAPAFRFLSRL